MLEYLVYLKEVRIIGEPANVRILGEPVKV